MNKYFRLAFVLALVVWGTTQAMAQDKDDHKTTVKQLIELKKYSFVAQRALPLRGRIINLTSPYDLKISGDTLMSDLPYFGRAFVAPLNPAESALRFTSTSFDYQVNERKKGGWDITILPKDTKDVRQMYLSVSESGYASLQVVSNNRQQISFNGNLTSITR